MKAIIRLDQFGEGSHSKYSNPGAGGSNSNSNAQVLLEPEADNVYGSKIDKAASNSSETARGEVKDVYV